MCNSLAIEIDIYELINARHYFILGQAGVGLLSRAKCFLCAPYDCHRRSIQTLSWDELAVDEERRQYSTEVILCPI